jgi:IPT/TIG domain/PQQ-like domain
LAPTAYERSGSVSINNATEKRKEVTMDGSSDATRRACLRGVRGWTARSSLLLRGLAIIAVAILALAAGAGSAVAEVTGASDNLRTGWYSDQPALTSSLLTGGSFQQVFKNSLHGQIYAQPLTVNGTLVVATEDNWVYGLDPNSGAIRWEKQVGTPVNALEKPIECPDLSPHIGITGTPVIDTEHGIVYFVSNQYVSGNIVWYMHAVELVSGNEVPNFPVEIKGEAQNLPGVNFRPEQELQRPGLLMMNGVVYAAFGSHCDNGPYQGWVAGVSTSGQLTTMWASARKGASIWQGGGGLISDGPGQILFATGNGEGNSGEGDPKAGPGKSPPEELGDSVVRVAVQPNGSLKASDFFSPFNTAELDKTDLDLGSGAPISLPSQYFGTPSVPHLLIEPSKKGDLYLLNRDELGGMGQAEGGKDKVVQTVGAFGGVWGGSAVWPGDGGYVYIPGVAPYGTGATGAGAVDNLRFFKYGTEKDEPRLSLAATSSEGFAFGSGAPIVTSNGATNGTAIVWITQCPPKFPASCNESKLRAYSAVPVEGAMHELFSAPIGQATKFSRPDASNGHIYVGNREGVVFGYGVPGLTPSVTSIEPAQGPSTGGTPVKIRGRGFLKGASVAIGSAATSVVVVNSEEITAKSAPGSGGDEVVVSDEKGSSIGGPKYTYIASPPPPEPSVTSNESGGAQTASSALTTPGVTELVPPISEPLVNLTHLQIRFPVDRHHRKHEAIVSFTLSAAGRAELSVYRRVTTHCHRNSRTCISYLPTTIKVMVRGHASSNLVSLGLGGLFPRVYRLVVTPMAASGTPGIARHVDFKAP